SIPLAPDLSVIVAFKVSNNIKLYIQINKAKYKQLANCIYYLIKPLKKDNINIYKNIEFIIYIQK
ncbi:unnamed protein product, partial [Clonostachys rhizophaga]